MRTVRTTIDLIRNELREIPDAQSEAELIVAHVLGFSRAAVLVHSEKALSVLDERRCMRLARKRARGYALAVVFGYREFYGMRFLVTKDTLVPRPETELLVELTLRELHVRSTASILDVGTGCGNIIIAIAKSVPDARRFSFFASDISRRALSVARENARQKHTAIHFLSSNLLERLQTRRFDIIVANLPYLATHELSEPSIAREPKMALHGGEKGLELYEKFITALPHVIEPHGVIFIEISPVIAAELEAFCQNFIPAARRRVHPDLSGKARVLELRI
ncbi:MAG: protein-(glutamine-N5) methyltransferase, release factor-specific [Candidatus Komeilibacteria bacterium RIFCSPHIGHO2_01_FULL_52_14]|uniref:peptide chain release factor N(5)-glutamine methyltransferase n=1 Tax=Candidatus Komeilibacteria bacterium RIFCSPHIGHO2_01_FULL_52_14 TaxID=1798549 RepID=A0A1G2BMX7_9BACT|nr:MAG: protein-(glutamine-N5) methyltransferase, release factor-specific [Candidatus Komeilibacteria bacterium RIFCSPHIGHO2_01_FULL_52_14]